jgi:D-glycero-alpha-D-manno-heptose-7-phosphate kinase
VIVRARAPLRISFCGGGTDLRPYVDEHGGAVLSATIARHASVTMAPGAGLQPTVAVLDDDPTDGAQRGGDGAGRLLACLVPAAAARLGIEPASPPIQCSLELDARPASGLGTSSAIVAAMVGALARWSGAVLDRYALARLACEVERADLAIPGGIQDQYAAVFGGFNFIEFRSSAEVVVTPLRIDPRLVAELECHLLLVDTGARPDPDAVIEAQVAGYHEAGAAVIPALDRLKELALYARDALVQGRLLALGELLDADWTAKKQTAAAVSNPRIDELYEEARRLGAVGGKVLGAGGGGFMLLMCPLGHRAAVARRLSQLGARPSTLTFAADGMRSWCWRDGAQGPVGGG